jgi:hypothetical protein
MPQAAYATTIKAGGPSTAITDEPTTKVTANTVYQITNTAKRILDPSVAVVVKVDADGAGGGPAVVATLGTYTIDYLYGNITFASDQGSAATVTVTGAYLSPVDLVGATEFSLSLVRALVDSSVFGTAGYRLRVATLSDFSGSVTTLNPVQRDLDAGGGVTKLLAFLTGGTAFLIEIRLGGTGNYFRGWILLEAIDEKQSPENLYEATLKFVSAPVKGNGQSSNAVFGFGQ